MIPSSDRHRLLEDTLMPETLACSLAAVRRAAFRRRVCRQTIRASAAACVVLGAAWVFSFMPEFAVRQDRVSEGSRAAPPPFVLVTNRAQPPPAIVRTEAAPVSLIVTTPATPALVSHASPDDLFASAGERPGGLVHLADGTARWLWLDVPELK